MLLQVESRLYMCGSTAEIASMHVVVTYRPLVRKFKIGQCGQWPACKNYGNLNQDLMMLVNAGIRFREFSKLLIHHHHLPELLKINDSIPITVCLQQHPFNATFGGISGQAATVEHFVHFIV